MRIRFRFGKLIQERNSSIPWTTNQHKCHVVQCSGMVKLKLLKLSLKNCERHDDGNDVDDDDDNAHDDDHYDEGADDDRIKT